MTNNIDSQTPRSEDVSLAEERSLWMLWRQQGDVSARSRLVERYLWLPRVVAGKALKDGSHAADLDRRDLVQAATIAMIESMDRFDIDANVSFATYCAKRIRGAILDTIDSTSDFRAQLALARDLKKERVNSLSGSVDMADRLKRVVEIAVGVAVGILLQDTAMFVDETVPSSPYSSGELLILRQNLMAIVAGLATQEQAVIKYHYYHDLSFAHIADIMGLTRARISQIHAKAVMSVRKRYADTGSFDQLA